MPSASAVVAPAAREQGLPQPYLLFLGDVDEPGYATTGLPVADPVRGGPAFDRLIDSCLAA